MYRKSHTSKIISERTTTSKYIPCTLNYDVVDTKTQFENTKEADTHRAVSECYVTETNWFPNKR